MENPSANAKSASLRQRLWRWHFFAGLIVCPFAILLSLTGTIYLFKPQIDHYEESRINALAPSNFQKSGRENDASLITSHIETLLKKYPNTRLKKVILNKPGDRSVEIELQQSAGKLTTYWVDIASGQVLTSKDSHKRFLHVIKKLHSELLLNNTGSYFVELMASWLMILIITGLYLWLSKPISQSKKTRQCLLPELNKQRPVQQWRSIHGVIGLWFALPILILLLSGLPWTQLWGKGFDQAKQLFGWQGPGQEWFVTLTSKPPAAETPSITSTPLWDIHSDHKDMELVDYPSSLPATSITLDYIVSKPAVKTLAHPIYIIPPKPDHGVWTVRSMTAQRSQRVTLHYDQYSGENIMRIGFEDHHPVERFVSHGVALHEGALFGWLNQLFGVLTALAVIGISLVGIYMWWLRKPTGKLGAPLPANHVYSNKLIILIIVLAIFLPAAGISILCILLLEYLWHKISRINSIPIQ